MVSCQREYGPALCNETAHTWALLQQLRHAASLRRLQQSCCSCTLCLLIILPQQPTSFSSETLLLLPQRHDGGCLHPRLKEPLVHLSSSAAPTPSSCLALFAALKQGQECLKVLQTPPNTYKPQTAHKTSHSPTGHPETNCGFCWSEKKAVLAVQRQQKGLFQSCTIHAAWG